MRLSCILALCMAFPAFAQDPEGDDVDKGVPAEVQAAKDKLEKAAAAAQQAKDEAAKKADPSKKVEKAKKPVEAPKKGPDLKSTTVPGANIKEKIKAAAAAQDVPAIDDSGLPDWAPAPDAISPTGHDGQPLDTQDWQATRSVSVGYPVIEHGGYMRMRMDLFHNFDLDTYSVTQNRGTSPVLPPLTELDTRGSGHPEQPDHRYRRGADTLAGANIRLRYDPTLHINENLRIRTTMDILDNIVLGSTPDGSPRNVFSRPDVPIETFSGTQRPPESGVNGYRDSVRVKRVWGEWSNLLGVTRFGRMPSHWGLGILANSGNCLDCDFGDNVDRLMHITKLFDTYLALSWDFPAEGFTGFNRLHDNRNQPFGQAHDFDQRDDVNQWVIAIFDRPMTKKELELRNDALNRKNEVVWDWGVYNVIRTQPFSSDVLSTTPPATDTEVALIDAKAFAYIPDVWFNVEYRPRPRSAYKLQFEAAGIFGVIEEIPNPAIASRDKVECTNAAVTNLDDCETQGGRLIKPRRRDITQWGYALEFDVRADQIEWGLHHGTASGDTTDGFGVLDKTPIDPNDSRDSELTNFKFDRDYQVDLILFREIIGAVTNATYFKPYLAYNFVDEDGSDGVQREKWGFQISAMYAHALEAKATPGNESPLGLEFDLELYIHEMDTFKWSLAYGILFPMGGLDRLNFEETEVEKEPSVAQTFQMMMGVSF